MRNGRCLATEQGPSPAEHASKAAIGLTLMWFLVKATPFQTPSPAFGLATGAPQTPDRSGRNVARTSSVNSDGCSQAAKWPPLSCFLKYRSLG